VLPGGRREARSAAGGRVLPGGRPEARSAAGGRVLPGGRPEARSAAGGRIVHRPFGQHGAVNWRERVATVCGRRLAYRRGGNGPRLLYLHDAGADTLASTGFDDLAGDHDVVLLRLPGYAPSDAPEGLRSAGDVARVLVAFLDQVGWGDPCVVAGTSLGGWFAAELAIVAPDRVAGLLLCDAAGLHVPEDYLFSLFAGGRAAASTQQLIEESVVTRLQDLDRDLEELPRAVAAAVVGPFVQDLAAAAAMSWHPYLVNPRMVVRARSITAPTVVLWGGRDALIPVSHGRAFAAAIPRARLQIVPDAGHLIALDRPDEFAAAVRSLTSLQRSDTRSGSAGTARRMLPPGRTHERG
jgi:pimeloyl-ACP methyl ester carboxylesterase